MSVLGNAVAIRSGEHACCRLAHAEDRERLALAFVRAGLARGEKVLYIVAREDTAALDEQLAGDTALAAALASGQLELRDATDMYTPDGAFDAQRTLDTMNAEHRGALAAGYSGLSVMGEMDWAVRDDVPGEVLGAYERGYAETAGGGTFAVFCQYDHGGFALGTLQELADAHHVDISPELGVIGREGGYLAAARIGAGADELLRLSGDLDYDAAYALGSVLGAHFHGTLRLDLTDLAFVDVGGMRALRGRTRQPLEIVAASQAVHRLLGLLAWDTDPAVTMSSAPAATDPSA